MTDPTPAVSAGIDGAAVVAVELPKELQSPSVMIGAIYSAIDAQRAVAVSYVRGIRRRQPDGSPADVIKALERHYLFSVTASGTAVGATAFIPGAGTVVALGAGAAELLLQFELAALFGLACAEVHGLAIADKERARALILSLMLGQEGRSKIANLAKAAIRKDPAALGGIAGRSRELSGAQSVDELPLAELLGTVIPADFVPSILDSVTDLAKKKLPEKAAAAGTRLMPGGIGMMLGGIGGYTAGNDVVVAARQAFGAIPDALPAWVELIDADGDGIPDPTAFETSMRGAVGTFVNVSNTAGSGIVTAAQAAGSGVSTAASVATRSFRKVDLDGDGIPDEARAMTAVKGVGRAAVGAGGAVRGATSSLFKSRKGDRSVAGDADERPSD